MVDDLLQRAIARRATDIHFEPTAEGLKVRFRVDGMLSDNDLFPPSLAENVVSRLMVMASLLTYRGDVPQEGSFQVQSKNGVMDVRAAVFPTVRGQRVALRLLGSRAQVGELQELGLAEATQQELRRLIRRPHGLFLVTGPAGSGKTTLLYSLAREILAATPWRSVISLEDPVEQRVEGMAQIQVSTFGELNYALAMRSLLRQDLDVLLVGEVRDAETAALAVQAAMTGHLILSTMHSGDPAETLSRLLQMGIAPYQVVGSVGAVCSLRLLRTVCSKCGGAGCDDCNGSGVRGRTACAQLVLVDDELGQLVVEHAPAGRLREAIGRRGGTLADDAVRLLRSGRVSEFEIKRVLGE